MRTSRNPAPPRHVWRNTCSRATGCSRLVSGFFPETRGAQAADIGDAAHADARAVDGMGLRHGGLYAAAAFGVLAQRDAVQRCAGAAGQHRDDDGRGEDTGVHGELRTSHPDDGLRQWFGDVPLWRRMPGRGLRRGAAELIRRGPFHRADLRAVADLEHHLAAELQRALHHRVRADHDNRLALAAPAEPAVVVRLVDQDAALDMRAGTHGDVAGHGFEAAGDVGGVQGDRAVDVGEMAAHLRALRQGDGAIDGLDLAVDLAAGGEPDRAVDGAQFAGAGLRTEIHRAVDGTGLLHHRVIADVHAAVHRADVAGMLAGVHLHAAVDLVDVV